LDELDDGTGTLTAEALDFLNRHVYWEIISKHLKKTLEAAGHQIGDGGIEKWAITTDASVSGPEDEEYTYASFEIVSPAFHYCPESIQAVEDFLAVLTSTYCINVNSSTGLHVHVGTGKADDDFRTVQKL
jgi:hypothetical protein